MSKECPYEEPQARLALKIAFLFHLSIFALINTGLIMGNYYQGKFSIILPIAWAALLVSHGLAALTSATKWRKKHRMMQINPENTLAGNKDSQ